MRVNYRKEEKMKKLLHSFMSVVAGAVVFLGLASISQAYTWQTYNGHEYAVTNTWESWVDAESEAVSQGGHLVTINDAAENAWVSATFKDYYVEGLYGVPGNAAVYIGYYLIDPTNNTWGWTSGETSTYTNIHYPSWYTHTGPHAYAMTFDPVYGTWGRASFHTEVPGAGGYLRGVIEIPEPTTMLLLGLGLVGLAGVRRKFKK
jgi:hypothetical protein